MLSVFFFRDRKIQGECCSEMYCNNEMLPEPTPEPTPEPEVGTSAASSGYFNKNYFALLYLIIYMMF